MGLTGNRKYCPYCCGQVDLINTLHHEYPHDAGPQLGQVVHIEGRNLVVEEETLEIKKINYCPMCGRRLGYAN